jgi:hypothetical protein
MYGILREMSKQTLARESTHIPPWRWSDGKVRGVLPKRRSGGVGMRLLAGHPFGEYPADLTLDENPMTPSCAFWPDIRLGSTPRITCHHNRMPTPPDLPRGGNALRTQY